MPWQVIDSGDGSDTIWVDDPVAAPAPVAQQVSGYSNTPIQQFNQLYQSGDYAGAGQLAAAQGYTPDQVTGYLNSTFGTNYNTANVAPYMTGIATPAPAPAPVVGPQPVAGPQPTLATTVANTPGITYEAGNYGLPTNAPQNLISSYYQSELGRAPDMGGVSYWANQVATGAMTLDQVRQALNASEEGVAFDANPITGAAALSNWLTKNPNATDAQIAYQMNLYGVTPEQAGSVFTGVSPTDIQQRYQAATPYVDLFNTYQAGDVAATNAALLKSGLTPDQLASAFSLDPTELQALRTQGYNIGIATPEITGAFGTVTDFENLNKGFEWAQANKVDDTALKKALGEDKYNAYTKQYGEGILAGLQPAFADGTLSGQEALDIGTLARKYGLDADEISKYTGLQAEVPKAIFDAYDKTLTGIVGNLLNPDSQATEADRIKSALALQSKYGLTDADIAKYSSGKLTEEQAKGYLEPVRNFATDFQKLFSSPDITAKDVTALLDKSRNNQGIAAIYGDKINEISAKIAEITPKWEKYGVDPLQAETLYSQINKITEAAGGQNWSGSWMSGGDNAAMEAAAMLQKRGVDNLSDLKVQPTYQKNTAVEMYQGQVVQTDDQGRKYLGGGLDEDGRVGEKTYLPAGTQTQFYSADVYESAGEGGSGWTDYKPLTEAELKTYDPKTGQYDRTSGNQLIDGSTGKVIAEQPTFGFLGGGGADNNRFVIDQYSTGNFFKGSDKTFGIQFTKDGVPVPFTTTEKTGLVTTPILPILATILGVPGLIGSGLAATGASALAQGTLLNTALSQGILSGAMSVAQDGSFGKGFLGGALAPVVGGGVASLLSDSGLNPNLIKGISSTAGNVASTAIRGGDVGDVLKGGITSGLLNYGLDQSGLSQSLNLSPQDLKLLSGVVVPALTTGKVNPYSMISALTPTGRP